MKNMIIFLPISNNMIKLIVLLTEYTFMIYLMDLFKINIFVHTTFVLQQFVLYLSCTFIILLN